MTFKGTLCYLVGFFVLYNALHALHFYMQSRAAEDNSRLVSWSLASTMAVVTLVFSFGGVYLAYDGFAGVYTRSVALVGACFFVVTGVVLLRSLFQALGCLVHPERRSDEDWNTHRQTR